MYGRLYASPTGWVLLSVPNALGHGYFDTLQEPGIELPTSPDGKPFNAHISVLRPEEIDQIGGIDKINERGHSFPYNTGPLYTITGPSGWADVSKVWCVEVSSPALEQLRRSYGLSSLPLKDGKEYPFHITVAVRKKNALYDNGISKAGTLLGMLLPKVTPAAVR